MILSALALSMALSMPNFALSVSVAPSPRNAAKDMEDKNYKKVLNPNDSKRGDTVFEIPLHGTTKKAKIIHEIAYPLPEHKDLFAWHFRVRLSEQPLIDVFMACNYTHSKMPNQPKKLIMKTWQPVGFRYDANMLGISCSDPQE